MDVDPRVSDDLELTLLRKAVAGDALALQAILASRHAKILAYVELIFPAKLRDVYDPRDVVQDTCIQAARRINEFQLGARYSVTQWLRTMARHRMKDLLRTYTRIKRGRGQRVRSVTGFLETLAGHRRSPSKSAAAHELIAAIEDSLRMLPGDQRRAIELRHFDRLPPGVAAQRMSRSEQAYHALCARGYKRLRDALRSRSIYA